MREGEREREAETRAEGEAGSMQEAQCLIPGLDPRTPGPSPGPKAGAKSPSQPLGKNSTHFFFLISGYVWLSLFLTFPVLLLPRLTIKVTITGTHVMRVP